MSAPEDVDERNLDILFYKCLLSWFRGDKDRTHTIKRIAEDGVGKTAAPVAAASLFWANRQGFEQELSLAFCFHVGFFWISWWSQAQ